MSSRRSTGSLESEVLACLWSADGALSPASVRLALGETVAYTTVLTVLTRLWQKQLVSRRPEGRGFVYSPRVTEGELVGRRMHADLGRSRDQAGALAHFVETLTAQEAELLRRAMTPDGGLRKE